MEKKNKIVNGSKAFAFILTVIVLGSLTFINLVRFYVNDEVDYNDWTAELGSKFETDIATCFFEKYQFVNVNGAIANLLGQPEMNGVVKLNNGYLFRKYDYISDEQLRIDADAVIRLYHFLDERGIPFLYLVPPYTSSKFDPQLPTGIDDYGNDDLDRLVKFLREEGVEVIDLRQTMHDDGIDQYDMMFRTDHHWTPRCGFYVYGKINDWLMERLKCKVDPQVMDLSNYTITRYEKWHLGYRGQRTGKYYAGMDDFDLIVPDFDTALVRDGVEGTYESLIINRLALSKRNYMSRGTYDSVYGNSANDYINNNALNDKRILAYTDSFGSVVMPFLELSYSETLHRFNTISGDDIEACQPDAVVMFNWIENIIKPSYYSVAMDETE